MEKSLVAQLAEQFAVNEEVVGSNPAEGVFLELLYNASKNTHYFYFE